MLDIVIAYTVVGLFIHVLAAIVILVYRKRLAADKEFKEWQEAFAKGDRPLEEMWRDVNVAMMTSFVMIFLSTLMWPVTFIAAMTLAVTLSLKSGKHF